MLDYTYTFTHHTHRQQRKTEKGDRNRT